MVSVGPPLLARPAVASEGLVLEQIARAGDRGTGDVDAWIRQSVAASVPEKSTAPSPAKIVLTALSVPPFWRTPPTEPAPDWVLSATVLLSRLTVPPST